jgi:hypothetical protein
MHLAPHAAHISKMVEMFKRGEVVGDCAMPMCKTCQKVEYPDAAKVFNSFTWYLWHSIERLLEIAPML